MHIGQLCLRKIEAFYQHPGVDVNQIKIAIVEHFKKGKRVRGASTITQQLVKNLFLVQAVPFGEK